MILFFCMYIPETQIESCDEDNHYSHAAHRNVHSNFHLRIQGCRFEYILCKATFIVIIITHHFILHTFYYVCSTGMLDMF